jgi:hypothetical protein
LVVGPDGRDEEGNEDDGGDAADDLSASAVL